MPSVGETEARPGTGDLLRDPAAIVGSFLTAPPTRPAKLPTGAVGFVGEAGPEAAAALKREIVLAMPEEGLGAGRAEEVVPVEVVLAPETFLAVAA